METKGRIVGMVGPQVRNKKDGTGSYTILEVDVQIGTYRRNKANYLTNTFEEVDEPDVIRVAYLGDDANGKAELLHVGDVVNIHYHHYLNHKFNRTEVGVDAIMPATVRDAAEQKQAEKTQAQAQAPAAGGCLPF